MIVAPDGYWAFYRSGSNGTLRRHRIVGWDDDGDALIVDQHGRRRPALQYRESDGDRFVEIVAKPTTTVAAVPGWAIEFTPLESDAPSWASPVVAWILATEGHALHAAVVVTVQREEIAETIDVVQLDYEEEKRSGCTLRLVREQL